MKSYGSKRTGTAVGLKTCRAKAPRNVRRLSGIASRARSMLDAAAFATEARPLDVSELDMPTTTSSAAPHALGRNMHAARAVAACAHAHSRRARHGARAGSRRSQSGRSLRVLTRAFVLVSAATRATAMSAAAVSARGWTGHALGVHAMHRRQHQPARPLVAPAAQLPAAFRAATPRFGSATPPPAHAHQAGPAHMAQTALARTALLCLSASALRRRRLAPRATRSAREDAVGVMAADADAIPVATPAEPARAVRSALYPAIGGEQLPRWAKLERVSRLALSRRVSRAASAISPAARAFGLDKVVDTLADASCAALVPQSHGAVSRWHARHSRTAGAALERAATELEQTLAHALPEGSFRVETRLKSRASVFEKAVLRAKPVCDLLAARVVLRSGADEAELLSRACEAVRELWAEDARRYKDYVAAPKPNGYQSVHLGVSLGSGEPLEVQLRTEAMHARAEHGRASWREYKASERAQPRRAARSATASPAFVLAAA